MRTTWAAIAFLFVTGTALAQPSMGAPYADTTQGYEEPSSEILTLRPDALTHLEGMRSGDKVDDLGDGSGPLNKDQIRLRAVREAALSTGMRAGLAWRYGLYEKDLRLVATHLSEIYDFSRLLLQDVVLPPVITIAKDERRQFDSNTARAAKVRYSMEYPARIVTTPPQWQDFLLKGYHNPDKPDSNMLPKNSKESKVWKEGVDEGWKIGVTQAEAIYNSSRALLDRAYTGMQNYHILLKSHVVSPPVLSRRDLGIVFAGQEVTIGDTVYELVAQPEFERPRDWTPQIRDDTQVSFPR